MKRKIFALTVIILAGTTVTPSYGAWLQDQEKWVYLDAGGVKLTDTWQIIDGQWYRFDPQGYMQTGWYQDYTGKWYFLNTISNGLKGAMLTGWQWIDGKCYYFSPETGVNNYPHGAMYAGNSTPDGYLVDESGAWISTDGKVQFVSGKGIQTQKKESQVSSGKKTSFSGGGSGGGSHSSSSSSSTGRPVQKNFTYTIKYLDIENKSVLKAVAGQAEAATFVIIDFPAINGYEVCNNQKKEFLLTENGMEIQIYYVAVKETPPSEKKEVSWELNFIEQGNPQNEIFKSQNGKAEEDTELVIDFPETILGTDGYYYHSLVPSPYRFTVNGAGIQKYTIEFLKGEKKPEEADPDLEARSKLEWWLKKAKEADYELTGQELSEQQIITSGKKESNERMLNLVSMTDDADPHEFYLIAKEHIPNSLIISQTFDDVINLSELVVDQFSIKGEQYTVMRIRFTRTYESNICSHDYQIIDKVDPRCLDNGHETVQCKKCGWEETVILPAAGHRDTDRDGICDICYGDASEVPEAAYYNIGDVQARNIGGKIYLFRCIDDDYEDAMNNSQKSALFLCDSVIRSDVDSTSTNFTKLSFGEDNNYKYSDVRKWLQNHATDKEFIHNSYIGITQSYTGITGKGTYEQFDESSLTGYDRQFQLMEDKIFCLSVEEAVKYRDYLWRFHGSDANNPESQLSAYSKGYYLRSPQNGRGIYVVDLADGSIHPVEVTSTEIGIRPAMTIPQGE